MLRGTRYTGDIPSIPQLSSRVYVISFRLFGNEHKSFDYSSISFALLLTLFDTMGYKFLRRVPPGFPFHSNLRYNLIIVKFQYTGGKVDRPNFQVSEKLIDSIAELQIVRRGKALLTPSLIG